MRSSALAALDEAPDWLNSEPLTAAGLRGRVVALDICTYSCVNWLRTLPYLRAWDETYPELVVIGVHSPEFGFEHDLANVRRAVADLGVAYAVVLDNDFAVWRSLDNHYWPALSLVDGEGRVRFQHFGEGAYAESERAIQELLGVSGDTVRVDAGGVAEAADWDSLRSPETYVGDARGERRTTGSLSLNEWALAGEWSVDAESARLEAAGGSLRYHFEGRDLNLVLGAAGVRFTVSLDGEPPGPHHGVDIGESGEGSVEQPRMYQLIRQRGPVRSRTFQITFRDPGVRAYVFTFG